MSDTKRDDSVEETNRVKTNFPEISSSEVNFLFKVLGEEAHKATEETKDHNCSDKDKCDLHTTSEIIEFENRLYDTLAKVPEFRVALQQWKMMLVLENRTTGLLSAFLFGSAIGLFLGRPDLVPSSNSENEVETTIQ